MEKMHYKVCFMGASFETGNRGVSALAASFIANVLRVKPDAEISFLMGNKEPKLFDIVISGRKVKARIINYRLSPRANIQEHLFWILLLAIIQRIVPLRYVSERLVRSNAWLNALKQADFVGNIHGGDSFSDIYGIGRFIINILDDIIALLMKKKLILLPQTYGPYNSFISRWIAAFIMNHSYKIYSRDFQRIEVVAKMLRSKDSRTKIIYCPDIAFTLDLTKIDLYQIEPPIGQMLKAPLVGLNINGLMYNGGYTKRNMFGLKCEYRLFLIKLVKLFMEETNANLLFVPHTFGPTGNINSDPDACHELQNLFMGQFNGRIRISTREYDQSEIKGIIGLCDFFIGSRMHACIAGLSQEIPTVGLAYSQKFQGVFDSVGAGNMVVDGRSLDTDEAVERVFWCYQNRLEMKANLQKKVSSAKNQIMNTFEEMLSA